MDAFSGFHPHGFARRGEAFSALLEGCMAREQIPHPPLRESRLMVHQVLNPKAEAQDSLARVLRAWKGKASPLPNGQPGNMTQADVQRCIAMKTIEQLEARVRPRGELLY